MKKCVGGGGQEGKVTEDNQFLLLAEMSRKLKDENCVNPLSVLITIKDLAKSLCCTKKKRNERYRQSTKLLRSLQTHQTARKKLKTNCV